MMQSTLQDSIRTLIIPLQGRNLLLPNVAVAEVIPYLRPRAIDAAPEWLLGAISWRGLNIPLISYDRLQGIHNESALGQTRIAVINTVRPDGGLQFYALVTAGIPQLKRINVESIQELSAEAGEGLLSQVQIGDIQAFIPDLSALESVVAECWQQVA
ncbi:MAG: CheW domain-containing protein [Gammaproteobacteria bacterium]|nr:CheW domain-containing protein [Gammaproteobacteria bacterium]